jgi:hypothetical protein
LLSLLLHAGLILILGLTFRLAPRPGISAERTAEVGITLKHQEGDREFYVGPDEAEASAAATSTGAVGLEETLGNGPPADPTDVLPASPKVIGLGALEGGTVGDAGQAAAGPGPRRTPGKGGARLSVFGTRGEGYKFVYVFDRSGSMAGSGRSALRAAKAELLASLKGLDTNHQFQIIFYNERPWQFNPSGQPGKLAFGTDRNKQLARKFIGGVTADGATRHEDALLMAIRLRPDVIFFLTDADEPHLTPGQLAKIHRKAGGIAINAIEFGFGPRRDEANFLVRLARQNGGQYAYVDISKLRPVRRD